MEPKMELFNKNTKISGQMLLSCLLCCLIPRRRTGGGGGGWQQRHTPQDFINHPHR